MESKLDRTRRLSKELKRCLEFLKCSDSCGSTQASFQSLKVPSRGRLSQTQKSETSLPLLSLSQRRNACKQLKIDSFKNIKRSEVSAIKEDLYEHIATPKLENLRVRPQKAEKSPNTIKSSFPASSNHQFELLLAKPSSSKQAVKETVGLDHSFKRMYARLVEKSTQAVASPAQLKKVVIQPRASLMTAAGKQPRKSVRVALPTKTPQGQPLLRR